MAMIAAPIPQNISRLFREIQVDGHRDPSDHITMFYLGDNVEPSVLFKAIPVIYDVIKGMKPFEVTCSRITTFPKGNHGYPVIAELKGDALVELRNKIKKALDSKKIKYDTTHADFSPHITLAYSKKKPKNIKLPGKMKIMLHEVALYGGDESDSHLFVNFPFTLGVQKQTYVLANKYIKQANLLGDIGHIALDVVGLIPEWGEPADLLNAAWYAGEKRYFYAALSLASVVPIVGDVLGKGGKIATWLVEKFPKYGPKIIEWVPKVGSWIRELKGVLTVAMPAIEKLFDEIAAKKEEMQPHIEEMKQALRDFLSVDVVESEDGEGREVEESG